MAKITKRAEILDNLHKLVTKEAELAQTNISGVPGTDTGITSVSDKTETTDKNGVGPEKLNKDQGYEQKDTKDKSEPLKGAKKAEDQDAVKTASYDIGRQFCAMLLQKTAEVKVSQEKQAEAELLKEAGRKDFDILIAQAAAELESQQANDLAQEKQAEAQGAAAFDELFKQAQFEAVVEENNALKAKIAQYETKEKEILAKEAAVKEEEKLTKMANLVFEKLKSELAATPAVSAAK